MPFQRALVTNETRKASSRIWTLHGDPISDNDCYHAHCATNLKSPSSKVSCFRGRFSYAQSKVLIKIAWSTSVSLHFFAWYLRHLAMNFNFALLSSEASVTRGTSKHQQFTPPVSGVCIYLTHPCKMRHNANFSGEHCWNSVFFS